MQYKLKSVLSNCPGCMGVLKDRITKYVFVELHHLKCNGCKLEWYSVEIQTGTPKSKLLEFVQRLEVRQTSEPTAKRRELLKLVYRRLDGMRYHAKKTNLG